MGETRDRGVRATAEGINKLENARTAQRNEDNQPWTYTELGSVAGVSDKRVRAFFKGESVDQSTARSICQALKLDVNEVIHFKISVALEEQTRAIAIDLPPSPDRTGQLGSNPFIYGNPVLPEKFYGRQREILEIKSRVGTAQSINLVGLRRNGKTSLLRYVQARPAEFFPPDRQPLIVNLDLSDQRFHTPDGIVEGLRREIQRQQGREPWAKSENDDPWAVQDGLEMLRDRNIRLIIMLDEFESIASRLEQFQGWGEDWRSKASTQGLFTLVIASKRPVSEIYQTLGLTSPFGNIFSTTLLGALEQQAWHRLVQEGFSPSSISSAELEWIDRLAGRLPYYVQLAAAMLWQHGDIATAQREFEFQAKDRFRELWQNLHPAEQMALQSLAGLPERLPPEPALSEMLQRYGLLRSTGQIFSSAFAGFVREQP